MAIQKKHYKSIKYYLDLPWTYTIETEGEDGKKYFVVRVTEIPGIVTDAESIEEAMIGIKEAMTAAFRLYMKHGDPIPEPVHPEKYKGNIAYRTSKQRHFEIAREAQRKNLSLSQLIDSYIDNGLASNKRSR